MDNYLSKFFSPAIKGQSYLNIVYLLLAFPLGLFYFIFLVTGISLGISLSILFVGIFILLFVFACWWGFAAFERAMAIGLLREQIPPMTRPTLPNESLLSRFGAYLTNPVTWKGLAYLLVKFPLGILSFVVCVTLISVTLSFIAAPLAYQYFPMTFTLLNGQNYIIDGIWPAIALFFAGVLLFFVSIHAFNGLAWVSAKFARVMLGGSIDTAPISAPIEEPA